MFATASAARTPFLSFEPRRELEPENRSHLKFRKFLRTAATLRFVCLDTPLATCVLHVHVCAADTRPKACRLL